MEYDHEIIVNVLNKFYENNFFPFLNVSMESVSLHENRYFAYHEDCNIISLFPPIEYLLNNYTE